LKKEKLRKIDTVYQKLRLAEARLTREGAQEVPVVVENLPRASAENLECARQWFADKLPSLNLQIGIVQKEENEISNVWCVTIKVTERLHQDWPYPCPENIESFSDKLSKELNCDSAVFTVSLERHWDPFYNLSWLVFVAPRSYPEGNSKTLKFPGQKTRRP
jgi:hypothetical protein